MPSPVRALTESTRAFGIPSRSTMPRSESTTCGTSAAGSRSIWLSTIRVTAECFACGAMNCACSTSSAYFCGSTTHTSASTWAARRSAISRLARSTESKSGRSSSTSLPARGSMGPSRTVRSRTCSQSRRSTAPSGSQTTACASDVVGRRTCVRATSAPTSAFTRLDFPLPVAPKMPTTVCSGERWRRSPEWVSTASRSRARASWMRPSPVSRTVRSAASRWSSVTFTLFPRRRRGARRRARPPTRGAASRATSRTARPRGRRPPGRPPSRRGLQPVW